MFHLYFLFSVKCYSDGMLENFSLSRDICDIVVCVCVMRKELNFLLLFCGGSELDKSQNSGLHRTKESC